MTLQLPEGKENAESTMHRDHRVARRGLIALAVLLGRVATNEFGLASLPSRSGAEAILFERSHFRPKALIVPSASWH